jgi:4'-phosphopantetheinyl transferase
MIRWALRTSLGWGAASCDRHEAALTAAERARLAGFTVPKRRADWLIGRMTAKAVVAEMLRDVFSRDWPLHVIEIPSDSNGEPYVRIAPEAGQVAGFGPGERLPIAVSISHIEGHAMCAATCSETVGDRASPPALRLGARRGRTGARRTLGVDLGAIEPRSPELVAAFFTADEQRFVRDAPPSERDLGANLIWCAKEAVLKALGVGLTVDTLDLSCLPQPGQADPAEWPMAPADHEWRPFIATCRQALVPGGATIRGIWCSFPGFVGALASYAAPVGKLGSPRTTLLS